jgi:hypothetical protein
MKLIQVYDRKLYTDLYKHVKEKIFTCGLGWASRNLSSLLALFAQDGINA